MNITLTFDGSFEDIDLYFTALSTEVSNLEATAATFLAKTAETTSNDHNYVALKLVKIPQSPSDNLLSALKVVTD